MLLSGEIQPGAGADDDDDDDDDDEFRPHGRLSLDVQAVMELEAGLTDRDLHHRGGVDGGDHHVEAAPSAAPDGSPARTRL